MLNSRSLDQGLSCVCSIPVEKKKNKTIRKVNHNNKIQQFIQLSADITEYSSPEESVTEAELKAKSKDSWTQHIHCWEDVAAVCNRFCSSSCAPEENRGNQGQNKDTFLLSSLQYYTKGIPGWNKILISDQRKGWYGPCCNLSSSSMRVT